MDIFPTVLSIDAYHLPDEIGGESFIIGSYWGYIQHVGGFFCDQLITPAGSYYGTNARISKN